MGEVLHLLDPRREFAGNGRKVPVRLEATASSYMQTNHHQHLRKGASKKTPKKKATPITIDSFFDSDNEDAMDYSSPRVASAKKSSDVRKISFDLEPE